MNEIVETFDGTPANRVNVRKIGGKYYEMGRQCFKMSDNKWHRINNGKIIFNYSSGKYILKKEADELNLTTGIVDTDDFGNPVLGCFEDDYNVVLFASTNSSIQKVVNEEVASKIGTEKLSNGIWYSKDFIVEYCNNHGTTFDEFINDISSIGSYSFNLNYNSSHRLADFTNSSNKYFDTDDEKYPFGKYLGSTTYGIEVETSRGNIPENKLWKTGLIACRDGSIGGHEYVTVPMHGSKGLAMIDEQFSLLKKYTQISTECSVHIHLGNYPLSKEYAVSVYRTLFQLQDEVYKLFPEYYANTSKFKQRDYNNPLPALSFGRDCDKNFKKIYNYLLGVGEGDEMNYPFQGFGAVEHPKDNRGNAKWHIPTRYHLFNLVPMIWGSRGTMEARIHTPTTNKTKITSWLFINKAILEFAFRNKNEISACKKNISGITLDGVMKEVYANTDLVDYLCGYIKVRKNDIIKQNKTVGGKKGAVEVKTDNNFEYSTDKIKSLL